MSELAAQAVTEYTRTDETLARALPGGGTSGGGTGGGGTGGGPRR
jgi:hypothetical protein